MLIVDRDEVLSSLGPKIPDIGRYKMECPQQLLNL